MAGPLADLQEQIEQLQKEHDNDQLDNANLEEAEPPFTLSPSLQDA